MVIYTVCPVSVPGWDVTRLWHYMHKASFMPEVKKNPGRGRQGKGTGRKGTGRRGGYGRWYEWIRLGWTGLSCPVWGGGMRRINASASGNPWISGWHPCSHSSHKGLNMHACIWSMYGGGLYTNETLLVIDIHTTRSTVSTKEKEVICSTEYKVSILHSYSTSSVLLLYLLILMMWPVQLVQPVCHIL